MFSQSTPCVSKVHQDHRGVGAAVGEDTAEEGEAQPTVLRGLRQGTYTHYWDLLISGQIDRFIDGWKS